MSKRKTTWTCITNCGACCRLEPPERLEALEVLNNKQISEYFELVTPSGWCRHYDTGSRKCLVYEDRPDFCRASELRKLYKIKESEADDFAVNCCKQQIRSTYGPRSTVLKRFLSQIRILSE